MIQFGQGFTEHTAHCTEHRWKPFLQRKLLMPTYITKKCFYMKHPSYSNKVLKFVKRDTFSVLDSRQWLIAIEIAFNAFLIRIISVLSSYFDITAKFMFCLFDIIFSWSYCWIFELFYKILDKKKNLKYTLFLMKMGQSTTNGLRVKEINLTNSCLKIIL